MKITKKTTFYFNLTAGAQTFNFAIDAEDEATAKKNLADSLSECVKELYSTLPSQVIEPEPKPEDTEVKHD